MNDKPRTDMAARPPRRYGGQWIRPRPEADARDGSADDEVGTGVFGRTDLQTVRDRAPQGVLPVDGLTLKQRKALDESTMVWHRLALHLLRDLGEGMPRVLAVTSTLHGEGKTVNSLGLARAFAEEAREPVALIEADLAHPSLAQYCGFSSEPGLRDLVAGRQDLEAVAQPTRVPGLSVVTAGRADPMASKVAADSTLELRRAMPDLLVTLTRRYRYVILDLPSVLGDVNTEEMARSVDAVILAVRSGVTPMEKMREATQLLAGCPLLAVIRVAGSAPMPRWLAQLAQD